MSMVFIAVLSLVFLAWGIVFLFRGLKGDPFAEKAIPVSDMQEIKEMNSEENKESPSDDGSLKDKEFSGEFSGDATKHLKQVNLELRNENQRLTEALNREISSKNQKTLSEQEKKMLIDKDKVIADLKQKNEAYAKDVRDLEAKIEKCKSQIKENENVMQARPLTEERISEADVVIGRLQVENDTLKKDIKKTSMEFFDKENAYQQEIAAVTEKLQEVSKELDRIKEQHAPDQASSEKTKMGISVVAAEEVEDLKEKIRDLETLNSHLQLKEKTIQYELTKSRAHALGLEKICDDFKVKMEQGS